MRYCMFCGEQLPDNAVFCPSCGARQPEPENKEEEKKEIITEEDESDNIALSLLSKANFVSNKGNNNKSIIPQYEPQKPEKKAKKVDSEGRVIVQENNESKEEHPETVKINTPSIKKMEEAATAVPDVMIDVKYEEEIDEEDAMMMSKMMEMMDKGSSYTPPMLSDIAEEIEQQKIEENYEQLTTKQEEEKESASTEEPVVDISKSESLKNKETTITADHDKSHNNKTVAKPKYKKRNLSEEDESEEESYSATMRANSTINTGNSNEELTADEIADIEKYKKYKESGDEKKDSDLRRGSKEGRTTKGEGRKSNGRKKEIRRNIDKEIQERDIRDIEHEEVNKKDDIDKDYDGYYENVRPIDFDKMHDNSAVIKTAITGAAVVILACTAFYFVLTFFLQ